MYSVQIHLSHILNIFIRVILKQIGYGKLLLATQFTAKNVFQ